MEQINKYIAYVSIVLNGILLMILFGVVPFLLYLSVFINLGLLWYVKKALEKISVLETDTSHVMQEIDIFVEHLENVHEMEMYYGDIELQNMINHSKQLVNEFVDFQVKHFDAEEIEEDEEELNEEEQELYATEEATEE